MTMVKRDDVTIKQIDAAKAMPGGNTDPNPIDSAAVESARTPVAGRADRPAPLPSGAK